MRAVVSIRMNMAKRLLLILLSFAVVCGSGASESESGAPLRFEVKRLKAEGIENFFALGTNIFSGGTPEGEEGFKALAKLGVKTIISVDGAQPNVERARAHGIRYVHLPHGYNGISRETQLQLVKAAEVLEGPIFIHCHHGQHRGPAAAAVVCMGQKGWSAAEGEAWLKAAGTGTNYVGLFETVRKFRRPSAEEIAKTPATFSEARKVSGLVDSMVAIDEAFERLKTLRAAADTPCPDNHLLSEATLLREGLREAGRLPDSKGRGNEFLKLLVEAENFAASFEQSVTSSTERAAIDRAFKGVEKSCAGCHRAHRDRAK
jgi:protein tyrosine phosphatase (PTP) superfamily phosphohydrolase (DUF442 family)